MANGSVVDGAVVLRCLRSGASDRLLRRDPTSVLDPSCCLLGDRQLVAEPSSSVELGQCLLELVGGKVDLLGDVGVVPADHDQVVGCDLAVRRRGHPAAPDAICPGDAFAHRGFESGPFTGDDQVDQFGTVEDWERAVEAAHVRSEVGSKERLEPRTVMLERRDAQLGHEPHVEARLDVGVQGHHPRIARRATADRFDRWVTGVVRDDHDMAVLAFDQRQRVEVHRLDAPGLAGCCELLGRRVAKLEGSIAAAPACRRRACLT